MLEATLQGLGQALGADHGQQVAAVDGGRVSDHQAVVVVEDRRCLAVARLPGGGEGVGEGAVDGAAPQGVEDDLALAVATARRGGVLLDHLVTVGEGAGGRHLLGEEAGELGGGGTGQRPGAGELGRQLAGGEAGRGPLQEAADALADEGRAVLLLGPPERGHGRGGAGRGDEHVVVRDALHPPGLDAEGEGVADRALPHELLVELAERRAGALEAQLEVAAVGDGPARQVEHSLGAGAGAHRAVDLVDRHQRLERAQPRRGVAAGEHGQDQVEVVAGQVVVALGAADRGVQVVDRPGLAHGHGEHDLGEHVESAGDRGERFEVAVEGGAGDDCAVDQAAAVDRVEAAARGLADAVAGAADALDHGRHRGRRLHGEDLVDLADVDAELERGGGDHRLELAGLEPLLDHRADLARQRAVVRPGELPALVLVDQARDLLDHPPAVGEDQRRPVAADAPLEASGEALPEQVAVGAGGHGRGRHVDRQLEAARGGGRDHLDRAWVVARVRAATLESVAADPAGDDLRRAHGGRQGDALHLAGEQREALDRGHQVDAALRGSDGVDLVEDDRGDAREEPPAAGRREQDVEGLGGGDQDLGRLPAHPRSRLGRRVAGAGEDADRRQREPVAGEVRRQLGERAEEVALDVVAEGAQRRHVEHRGATGRERAGGELVQGPEEGGEGLTRPGRRGDQDVLAGSDARPGERLDLGRRAEAGREPVADGGREEGEGHQGKSTAAGGDGAWHVRLE